MGDWSRREVLAALGAAAPLLAGCQPLAAPVRVATSLPVLRAQLGVALRALERIHGQASAWVEQRAIGEVAIDAGERRLLRTHRTRLVLSAETIAGPREAMTLDLSAAGIARAAAALGATLPDDPRGAAAGLPLAVAATRTDDPAAASDATWLAAVGALFARAAALPSSSLVYRQARLALDDRQLLWLTPRAEASQRVVRARVGVDLCVWDGDQMVVEAVDRAGPAGLALCDLPADALAAAAARALETMSGEPLAPAELAVILAPEVSAAWFDRVVVPGLVCGPTPSALAADRGAAIGPSGLTVRDDPGQGYGGYRFDDEGWPAAAVTLIERGVVTGRLCDAAGAATSGEPRRGHGRRDDAGVVSASPSHVVVDGGPASIDELVRQIELGYLIEAPLDAAGDPTTGSSYLAARRAREIVKGRLTGRRHGPVALTSDVRTMLGATSALGRDRVDLAGPAAAPPRSISAPALVTRAALAELG